MNRYTFLGRENQVGTGYMDLQARFYDPALGRFLQIDPITDGQDNFSPYHYSFNNPVRFSDPDGKFPECCGGFGDFLTGVGQALSQDIIGGAPITATPGHAGAFNSGVTTGHYVAMAIGAAEIAVGALGATGAAGTAVATGGGALPVAIAATTVAAAAITQGASIGSKAAENLRNDKGTVNASSNKQEGSYTNTHESGKKYHGKGDETRAQKSGTDKAKANNDPVKKTDWKPSDNSRQAYKDESRRLQKDGGHRNPNNYNKRDSPGTKYRKQDGE